MRKRYLWRGCARQLRRIDPHIKAIVVSGYSSNPVMSEYRQYGFNGVVSKPFRIEDLCAEVQRVMQLATLPGMQDGR